MFLDRDEVERALRYWRSYYVRHGSTDDLSIEFAAEEVVVANDPHADMRALELGTPLARLPG